MDGSIEVGGVRGAVGVEDAAVDGAGGKGGDGEDEGGVAGDDLDLVFACDDIADKGTLIVANNGGDGDVEAGFVVFEWEFYGDVGAAVSGTDAVKADFPLSRRGLLGRLAGAGGAAG